VNAPDDPIAAWVDAVCDLSRANTLTGIWDNRRFQACKRPVEEVDPAFLYKTEKLSRRNVEVRAVCRTQIDVLFERIVAGPASAESAP